MRIQFHTRWMNLWIGELHIGVGLNSWDEFCLLRLEILEIAKPTTTYYITFLEIQIAWLFFVANTSVDTPQD